MYTLALLIPVAMKNRNLLLTLTFLVFSVGVLDAQTPVKKVLMEEFTTVLCGVCPPATFNINQYHSANPNSILITHHEGFGRDSMSNATTLAIYNAFKPTWGSFAPAIMIERTVYPTLDTLVPYLSTFTSGYDTLVDNALQEPPMVEIQISSQYFWGSGSLLSSVTATFVDPLPAGDYRINLFLVEDSVTGFGYPGYAQKCYDGNFVAQHYPGYPYANDTISGYPHRYVVRQSLAGNAFGTSQTIPVLASGQSPSLGTPYVFTMSAPVFLPLNYNFDRLHLVASVNRFEQGSYSGNYVVNANSVKLSENISTGIGSSFQAGNIHVYPNPAVGNITVSFNLDRSEVFQLHITDIGGRTVYSLPAVPVVSGKQIVTLDTGYLMPGIYNLHIVSPLSTATEQVIVTR
jgi:Secretion system C-terminal sorting domain